MSKNIGIEENSLSDDTKCVHKEMYPVAVFFDANTEPWAWFSCEDCGAQFCSRGDIVNIGEE